MSRFEIVRSDAPQPWHARFVAANGRIVWVTETYARKRGAENAVELICGTFIRRHLNPPSVSILRNTQYLEVRYLDERGAS